MGNCRYHHNFQPGETVEKQIIIINNSRQTVTGDAAWTFALPQTVNGGKRVTIETGEQARIPLRFALPATLAPGEYELTMKVKFNTGGMQEDSFAIHVLPKMNAPKPEVKIALYDPKGETEKLLNDMGIHYDTVDADVDLSGYSVLVVGKAALTVDGPAPDIGRVRDGLKALIFEQKSDVLEKRFGFRVQEYGLRRVFKRVPDHPILQEATDDWRFAGLTGGLDTEHLRDWRGKATIVSPRLKYELRPRYGPTIEWSGIKVTRAWRSSRYGNVASVLIEKPARGDFLPIVDGGFDLQYSPLMEYREGKGIVLFCQMDVTGRTESDPAAIRLVQNLLNYVSTYKPTPQREPLYVGEQPGKEYFEKAGMSLSIYQGGVLNANQVLIVGPGGGQKLADHAGAVGAWLREGGNLLTIGLTEQEANAFLPFEVRMKKAEHISTYFEPAGIKSPLAGIGSADVSVREPRELPLVLEGASIIGDGVLATAKDFNVVFCQLVPWQFDYEKLYNLKMTFRRTSFLVSRLLANMGAPSSTLLLSRFANPVGEDVKDVRMSPRELSRQGRWLNGFYLDSPVEMDDPYRFFRW